MDRKKQSKLGGMFDIPIKDHVFYGCVMSYWNIAEQKKPHIISLVLIENQNRLDRIGKITLPTGIRFSLYCGENHIGKYWPIIDYLNVNDIPKFLLRTNVAGHVYEVVPETGEMITLPNENPDNYQTFYVGNHGAVECILENAQVEFVDLNDANLKS